MTKYEKIMSMSIDEFASWFANNCENNEDQAFTWYDKTYCSKCEKIKAFCSSKERTEEFAYCELYGKCRFFPELNEVPDVLTTVKLWLQSDHIEK